MEDQIKKMIPRPNDIITSKAKVFNGSLATSLRSKESLEEDHDVCSVSNIDGLTTPSQIKEEMKSCHTDENFDGKWC